MKSLLLVIGVAALIGAATVASARPAAPGTSSPRATFFGSIKAVRHTAQGYELRFDPAWWLTGHAAQQASFEDTGSRDVPNDYYIVDEGHRLLSFLVAKSTVITVLTRSLKPVRISAWELGQIVRGKNPRHRALFSPKANYWLEIGTKYPNPAITVRQQYQP